MTIRSHFPRASSRNWLKTIEEDWSEFLPVWSQIKENFRVEPLQFVICLLRPQLTTFKLKELEFPLTVTFGPPPLKRAHSPLLDV